VGVALRRSLVMGALPAMMDNRWSKGDARKKRLSFVKQVFQFLSCSWSDCLSTV
jgi:hypothetical protein